MNEQRFLLPFLVVVFLVAVVLGGWWFSQSKQTAATPKSSNEVVIYVATDQDIAEPILQKYQSDTGVKVNAIYDTEATKSVGLVNKLIAEKNNPQADVFWNNEASRTIKLKRQGVLAAYVLPNALSIPDQFKDADNFWTGFSARARVLIYNKNLLPEADLPESINDLLNPKWQGKVVMANPLFGSTTSWAVSLFTSLGDERAQEFFNNLQKNGVVIVESNSAVRDEVANGQYPLGLTDTDDVSSAIVAGKPVGQVFLDQEEGGLGTMVFPNTVMLMAGAPHEGAGKQLIDYLLSPQVESALAFSNAVQMPLRANVEVPNNVVLVSSIKPMSVNWEEVADKATEVQTFLQNLFIR